MTKKKNDVDYDPAYDPAKLRALIEDDIDFETAFRLAEDLFGTGTKKRGMGRRSLEIVDAMHDICEAAQPITGRGVGYKLFTAGLIPSMGRNDMHRVYRLLKDAREQGIIPWEWIVDETRSLERASSWDDPAAFVETVSIAYRRDFWNQQPHRVEVWSEKGTIRGVLQPILDEYGVGFRVMHGFGSATAAYDIAQDGGTDLIALYVGDYDPSGLYMSEVDLPERVIERYGGDHVQIQRIALLKGDLDGLPSFPAETKRKDPRFRWFTKNYGKDCWELDAMDPNNLRDRVENQIRAQIDIVAWDRCVMVQAAEQQSLRSVLDTWKEAKGGKPI